MAENYGLLFSLFREGLSGISSEARTSSLHISDCDMYSKSYRQSFSGCFNEIIINYSLIIGD